MDTPPWPLYIPQFLMWIVILSHLLGPDLKIMTSLNIEICFVIFLVLVYGKQDDRKDMFGSRQSIMQVFHTWISWQSIILLNLSFQITRLTLFICAIIDYLRNCKLYTVTPQKMNKKLHFPRNVNLNLLTTRRVL